MTTTGERLATLETKVENVQSSVNQLSLKFDEMSNKIENSFKDLDDKYASKMTEKIVYAMVGTILTAVLAAVLTKSFGWW